MTRTGPWRRLTTSSLAALIAAASAASCNGGGAPAPAGPERSSILVGDRTRSAPLKTAENRPHPWEPTKGVFQTDRLDIKPAMARARAEHAERHRETILVMSSFSHPACRGLTEQARRQCPLMAAPWRVLEDVPGGVALVAQVSKTGHDAQTLHQMALCHVAFGRTQEGHVCPLHLDGVRVTVRQRDDRLVFTITTSAAGQVEELRGSVHELVP